MRLFGLIERIGLTDGHLDLAYTDHLPQPRRTRLALGRIGIIIEQRRPDALKRSLSSHTA